MSDLVLYDVDGGVALLTLNRPDKLNAWTLDMGRDYLARMEQAATDPDVRVVVVTGAGRGFCAGADLSLLTELVAGAAPPQDGLRPEDQVEPTVPKPVIAAINGPCVGLGLTRAMYCDLRFLAAGTELSTAFARRGLVAEHGMSWMLPRLVGWSRAVDLLMSGRSVGSDEALAIGLVDRIADDALGAALDYAREIVRCCSPAALRDIKQQLWADAEATFREALDRSAGLMLASFSRPDLAEGVVSFLEKRAPDFPPLR
ncbi:MAG TPA: enoyl-CoA hydratase-related protein [Mycobacteriales bacterium]|nr:enoyl-CoA hydratase-related protein [Mycobacteriales bacterium]